MILYNILHKLKIVISLKYKEIDMDKSKVYFTRILTPEALVEMYKVLGANLPGKVAVKLHSGEREIKIM